MSKVEVFKDAAGEWRWHRRADNNRIVATSGEGYHNYVDCYAIAQELNPDVEEIETVDE